MTTNQKVQEIERIHRSIHEYQQACDRLASSAWGFDYEERIDSPEMVLHLIREAVDAYHRVLAHADIR